MTVADDYFRLRDRGVVLGMERSRLRADSPQGLDPECQAILRRNAGEFSAWLWAPITGPDGDNPNAIDAWHDHVGAMAWCGANLDGAVKAADERAAGHGMYDRLWVDWARDQAEELVAAGVPVRVATGRVLRLCRSVSPSAARVLRARARKLRRRVP